MKAILLLSVIAFSAAIMLTACSGQEDSKPCCGDPNRVQLSNSR